jgi:phosphopantothenoylcysteine decarboxylase/phosphopantothenate--cysteine ligase
MPPGPANPCRLLITAGPTHEPIDAVRYVGNRSSGRLGVALAEAATAAGHVATLLLGPTALPPPADPRIGLHRFTTAADLAAVLARLWPEHDVLVMAAAVADFRPRAAAGPDAKLPRGDGGLTLDLEPTPDLLADLAPSTRPDQTVIGFALEPPERLLDSARRKLAAKRLDAIVANPLETMDAPAITATVLLASGATLTPPPGLAKPEFAAWLVERLPEIRRSRASGP